MLGRTVQTVRTEVCATQGSRLVANLTITFKEESGVRLLLTFQDLDGRERHDASRAPQNAQQVTSVRHSALRPSPGDVSGLRNRPVNCRNSLLGLPGMLLSMCQILVTDLDSSTPGREP